METRKRIRLREYDYSQAGVYFVTICTRNREPLLWERGMPTGATCGDPSLPEYGHPVGATCGRPPLSQLGETVEKEIVHLSSVYPSIWVEKYVVMPDHIHLLLCIGNEENGRPQVAPTVPRIMQQFKGAVSKKCGRPIWQKGYHDHIIRDENDFLARWNYIDTNPARRMEREAHL